MYTLATKQKSIHDLVQPPATARLKINNRARYSTLIACAGSSAKAFVNKSDIPSNGFV